MVWGLPTRRVLSDLAFIPVVWESSNLAGQHQKGDLCEETQAREENQREQCLTITGLVAGEQKPELRDLASLANVLAITTQRMTSICHVLGHKNLGQTLKWIQNILKIKYIP